jgi:hypothetical protein
MHHAVITQVENPGPVALASKWRLTFIGLTVIGVLAFAAAVMTDPARAWHGYLVSYFMFLAFGIAGLFFVAINNATNAKWMIVIRRLAEGFTAYLPVALVLFVGIVFGMKHLYQWSGGATDMELAKARWLSPLWVTVRGFVFLAIWVLFSRLLVGWSVKQDQSGDAKLSRKAINLSVVFLPIFAGTFTLAAFDWIMSLQYHFFSTMYGVYCFAGMFQSGLALLTIVFIRMKQPGGPLHAYATQSHVKDLGGLVFAFTVFMTYIGFSQFMLIWYANMPEETFYFMQRLTGGWQIITIALPFFKFAVPFFGLLGQGQKKNEKWLTIVCWTIIIGQFLDLYWLVMPTYSKTLVPIGWMEIGIWLGFAGIFGLTVSRFYAKHSIMAARDPRILESVNWRMWE